jgi:polyhydroxyalkanoate synthesis regulator phasin
MNREEQVFIKGKLSLEEMKEFVDEIENTEINF